MEPNADLNDAIFRSGRRQSDIAKDAGIHYTRLSKIVRGRIAASKDEQKALARVLKMPVYHLFRASQERSA